MMLLLAFLFGAAIAQEWERSEGACRGGESPGNNAGLKFFRDRTCKDKCAADNNCTGYVVPKSNSNWCETYTSKGAKGDTRTSFWCYMKTGKVNDVELDGDCIQGIPGYRRTGGACRGGQSPGNNAGLKFFRDRNCHDRCKQDNNCSAWLVPQSNSNWCETYTSKGVEGDYRKSSFWCYMKDESCKPKKDPKKYIKSLGACRGGRSPANNAGLKFYSNRNCQSVCDEDDNCTGFVLPQNDSSNWCETYTSEKAVGDERNFWCFMKEDKAVTEYKGEYVQMVGACRGGQSPADNAGLKFYSDRNCRDRCNKRGLNCTGYVLPVNEGLNWCETYTSNKAVGDLRKAYYCYMKETFAPPKPTPPPTPKPTRYTGPEVGKGCENESDGCQCYSWYTASCATATNKKDCKRAGCSWKQQKDPQCQPVADNKKVKCKKIKWAVGKDDNRQSICSCFKGCSVKPPSDKSRRRRRKARQAKCQGEHAGF